MLGEQFDAASYPPEQPPQEGGEQRTFIGIHFICCDVYARVYIDRDRSAYSGNCPKCAKQIRIGISPGGTSSRFFTVQ